MNNWIMNTNANFHKKDVLEILCLKTIIPINAPALPKKKAASKRNFSDILFFPFTAKYLSNPYIKNTIRLIIAIILNPISKKKRVQSNG